MKEHLAAFLETDTISYLEHLRRKWGLKSKSDVVEEMTRRLWKAEQVALAKKMDKARRVA